MKKSNFLFAIIAIAVLYTPIVFADTNVPPPLRHNFLSNSTEGVTILDTAKHEETFEWECPGPVLAEDTNDLFECSWTYYEIPDSTYMEVSRTFDEYAGIFAANWVGPDAAIMEKTEVQGL